MNHRTSDHAPQAGWFKSSFSSNANQCVEVRFDGERVSIRDSKFRRDPANHRAQEPIITVTAGQWTSLLDGLTAHPAPRVPGALHVEPTADGGAVLRAPATGVALTYTAAEWRAYLAGVRAGEFSHPGLSTVA